MNTFRGCRFLVSPFLAPRDNWKIFYIFLVRHSWANTHCHRNFCLQGLCLLKRAYKFYKFSIYGISNATAYCSVKALLWPLKENNSGHRSARCDGFSNKNPWKHIISKRGYRKVAFFHRPKDDSKSLRPPFFANERNHAPHFYVNRWHYLPSAICRSALKLIGVYSHSLVSKICKLCEHNNINWRENYAPIDVPFNKMPRGFHFHILLSWNNGKCRRERIPIGKSSSYKGENNKKPLSNPATIDPTIDVIAIMQAIKESGIGKAKWVRTKVISSARRA